MFQGLSIALVQLKPVNTSENLLNKIRLVNSENSKTYVSQRLLLNLSDNTDREVINMFPYKILEYAIHGRI